METFTASELRARIQKQVFSRDAGGNPTTMVRDGDRIVSAEYAKHHGKFPSLLQSAEDERRRRVESDSKT